MKQSFVTFFSLLLFTTTFSQSLPLEIHKNKLDDFIKYEEKAGGKRIKNESRFISEKGVAQPVTFIRPQTNLPDLRSYIFYFEKDSAIDYILYEWTDPTPRDEKNARASSEEITTFINKYKEIHKEISLTFGPSTGNGGLDDLSLIESGNFNKEDRWIPNDSTEIRLSMTLSSRYEQKGNITIAPTYRMRLYINTIVKNQSGSQKLTESKLKELDKLFKEFLSSLQQQNIDATRLYLSGSIKEKVSNEQLQSLLKTIHIDDSLTIYLSGTQFGLDGSQYIMVQYRYATDNAHPPKEMIKVIFDNENKIMAVQPLKSL
jgi:hypothetical protein